MLGITESLDGVDDVAPFTRRQLFYLLMFTVCATVLRLWDLGTWSFWIDEAHTFRDVISRDDQFWESSTSKYPLYFLILRFATQLFELQPADLTEAVMRLPSAFFGIASVPLLAVVGRGIVGRRPALLAALLLAISPWHIYWSQNARFYAMVLFFCLSGMGALYHGFQRSSWWTLLLATGLFFVGAYSHPSAYVMMASALVYLLLMTLVGRERRTTWLPLVILVLMAVIVVTTLPILSKMSEVKRPVFSLFHLIQTMAFYIGIPVLVAALGGMIHLFDRGARPAAFLTCMVALPLLALSVLSSVGSALGVQRVTAQYAFATLPAVYLLASALIIALVQVFRGKGLRSLTLRLVPLAMIVLHMLGQDYMYFSKQYGWRPRWGEAIEYIKNHHERLHPKRDLVVVSTNGPSVRYYLDPANYGKNSIRDGAVQIRTIEEWDVEDSRSGFLATLIREAREEHQDLWLVLTEPELDEKDLASELDVFIRWNLKQVRRLPNWTGPKDMVVLIYHLD